MKKLKIKNSISVPVIVDAIAKDVLVRCTYYSIECTEPSPGWTLGVQGLNIPFIMLGLQGIVYKPIGRGESFSRPEQIDELFDTIDRLKDFFIDTNEVWFLRDVMPKAERGMVYRVPLELFNYGLTLPSKEIEFIKETAPSGKADFSRTEHKAFSLWAKEQIVRAREHYWKMNERGKTLRPREVEGGHGE